MPFKELNCSSCTFTDMLQFMCFDILSILFSSALIKRICSFQASFSYCKANILCFLHFFPISLSMTEISCLPPTDHHPSISSFLFLCCPVPLQTARTLTSTLMMAGVNPKFFTSFMPMRSWISLILFVNWLFRDLECKWWYYSLQLQLRHKMHWNHLTLFYCCKTTQVTEEGSSHKACFGSIKEADMKWSIQMVWLPLFSNSTHFASLNRTILKRRFQMASSRRKKLFVNT